MPAPSPTQATLAAPLEARGVGIHSGAAALARVLPAPAGHGRRFVRVDLPGAPEIPAQVAQVRCSRLATCLAVGEAEVSTVEHLLAALHAAGVHNARIEVDGPELPALDGSAKGWWEQIDQVGVAPQEAPTQPLRLTQAVEVRQGESWARATPAEALQLCATVAFEHPAIGRQSIALELSDAGFGAEIAWARTFGFLEQVEQLRAAGLARGGSLENAIVFGPQAPLNPEGLRAPDEVVRHKMLDLIGDLALLDRPLLARVEAFRPGHALTRALVQAILEA